jgi:hypothetical protein
LGWAASATLVVAAAACENVAIPTTETRSLSELVVLGIQPGSPSVPVVQGWIVNSRLTVLRLHHDDAFNQLYAEVRFPQGALTSVDGQVVAADDSVFVTLQAHASGYGLTVSPTSLAFTAGSRPSVTFSYGRYGDLSVADGTAYPSRDAYADALDVWQEAGLDRWSVAIGSGPAGLDAVTAFLADGSELVVAAPR